MARFAGHNVSAKYAPWPTLVGVLCVLPLASLSAQRQDGLHDAPWHAALRLRQSLQDSAHNDGIIPRLVSAELGIGRAAAALGVLRRHIPVELRARPELLALQAAAEYGSGDYAAAGRLYGEAAVLREDAARARLHALAGDAFERAGETAPARAHYRVARERLPLLAAWIALREARVADDTIEAFQLLAHAPPPALTLAAEARARVLILAGDTARAVDALDTAGRPAAAAFLALERGDSTTARVLAYRAARHRDTAVVRDGVRLLGRAFPPRTPDELMEVAEAHRRLGDQAAAARHAERVVLAGDSSAGALRFWGDMLAASGQRTAALAAYLRASRRTGSDALEATYHRARLLVRVGRVAEGYDALRQFADGHAQHPHAPVALYLVAEHARDAGRLGEADSLYGEISRRWPRDEYAARARFQLASSALARADTARALQWYRAEIGAGGAEQHAARFVLGRIHEAAGEGARAHDVWADLARRDSIGYYGTVAREAARLPAPQFRPVRMPDPIPEVRRILELIDEFLILGWENELDALVAYVIEHAPQSGTQMLALGQGLIERGRVSEGVTLGWRATRDLSLNDTRVLRVIFPWPMRSLIEAEARKHELDPYLVAGLIRQESTFRPTVVSRAGAVGLMQLMPTTAAGVARRLRVEWEEGFLGVADANLHVGAAHLAGLLQRYDGDEVLALAAYNAGGRPVERWRRLPEAGDRFFFIERIPYVETRGYVRSVLRNWALYRALYADAGDEAVSSQ